VARAYNEKKIPGWEIASFCGGVRVNKVQLCARGDDDDAGGPDYGDRAKTMRSVMMSVSALRWKEAITAADSFLGEARRETSLNSD
jgi:hypothetical protein